MSMTQSRKVRRLVSSVEEVLSAIKDINFPHLPIEVLSYPQARHPWNSQKFQRTVATQEDLLNAVAQAFKASTVQKAILIGWPVYPKVEHFGIHS